MKKWLAVAAICALLIGVTTSKSSGIIAVFDEAAFAQMLLEAVWWAIDLAYQAEQIANQVTQIANQVLQYEMLIQQYETMVTNLLTLEFDMSMVLSGAWGNIFARLQNALGMTHAYLSIGGEFAAMYPVFNREPMGGGDYVLELRTWSQQVRDAGQGAMSAQAIAESLEADVGTLEGALRRSDAAAGNLQVHQAGNQIEAIGVTQLMRIQQMMAQQGRAETSATMMEAAEKDQALGNAERWLFAFTYMDPVAGLSQMPRLSY
jgi:P-type conjugative transfer protein TrbJ